MRISSVVLLSPLCSWLDLGMLTNMVVTNGHMFNIYINDLFQLLLVGNGNTEVQVPRLLLNLLGNSDAALQLLGSQVD